MRGIAYPIPDWEFCIAFSFFRLAVIVHGVACRLFRNQASSSAFTVESASTLANLVVEAAFYAAEGGGAA